MLASDNPVRDDEPRQIILHVNYQDTPSYNFVLNNVENLFEYYQGRETDIEIRVITHGLGLHLLRQDTSPVQERISELMASQPALSFYACKNTQARMEKAEGKKPEVMEIAQWVPSGLVEVVELQRAGWTYLKP